MGQPRPGAFAPTSAPLAKLLLMANVRCRLLNRRADPQIWLGAARWPRQSPRTQMRRKRSLSCIQSIDEAVAFEFVDKRWIGDVGFP